MAALAVPAAAQYHILDIYPNGGTVGELRMHDADGSAYEGFKAADTLSGNLIWTLPSADGASGQALVTDGSKVLSWATVGAGSGCVPGGSDGQILMDNASSGCKVLAGFSHSGDVLNLPRSASSPSNEGGQVTLQGDTGSGVDYNLDIFSGSARLFISDGSTRQFQVFNAGAGDLDLRLTGDYLFGADSTYTIGTSAARPLNSYLDNLDLRGNLTFDADSAYDIGTAAARVDELFADNAVSEDYFIRRQGAGSYDYLINSSSTNFFVRNSAGDPVLSILASTSALSVYGDVLPTSVGAYDLGSNPLWFDNIYGQTIHARTAILPDVNEGANLGSASLFFDNGYFDDLVIDSSILPDTTLTVDLGSASQRFDDLYVDQIGSPGARVSNLYVTGASFSSIVTFDSNAGPLTNGSAALGTSSFRFSGIYGQNVDISSGATIHVGSGDIFMESGNLYLRDVGVNATSLSCSSPSVIGDGWAAITNDNYLVVCNGSGSRFRAALTAY